MLRAEFFLDRIIFDEVLSLVRDKGWAFKVHDKFEHENPNMLSIVVCDTEEELREYERGR